jgi:hypothetical protein
MQASGTNRNAGNLFEGFAADAAVVGENQGEEEVEKTAGDPLR